MKVTRKKSGMRVLAKRRPQILRAHSQGVKIGVDETKHLCPVDKGDLVSTRTVEDKGGGHVEFGIGGPSKVSSMHVNHHIYIEYGTSKMAAQPNFRPGIDAAKQGVRRKLRSI